MVQEQQAWIGELERGKAWLEGQAQEQQAWIGELEQGKAWLEEQRTNWQAQAEHWQAQTRQWQSSFWGRLGLLLKIVKPAQELSAKESEPDD